MLHQTFSDYTGRLDQMSQQFLQLKQSFDTGVNIQTALVSFRIEEKVDTLSMYLIFSTCAYMH